MSQQDNDYSLPELKHTQIPNVVFDYWMKVLKSGEFLVLLCLCRKILGWHKTTDTISANQIAKCTGLSKKTIIDALDSLQNHGLVKIYHNFDEYGNKPNSYSLVISKPKDITYCDSDEDEKKSTGGSVIITPPLVKKLHHPSVIITPTKERPTKETLPPPHTPPEKIKKEEEEEDIPKEFFQLIDMAKEKKLPFAPEVILTACQSTSGPIVAEALTAYSNQKSPNLKYPDEWLKKKCKEIFEYKTKRKKTNEKNIYNY